MNFTIITLLLSDTRRSFSIPAIFFQIKFHSENSLI